MASLAKTNKAFQRLHRERHQPESRKRFGYLEKKKDYKTRALDHQKKVQTINNLKEKVANKNPNEFVFHMINSNLVNGRHFERQKESENVKEVVSKNLKWLNWKRGVEMKKIEKLQSELHFINATDEPVNKKTIFKEIGPKKKLIAIEVNPNQPLKKKSTKSETDYQIKTNIKLNSKVIKKVAKAKETSYKNLMKRLDREKKLRNLIVKNDFTIKKPEQLDADEMKDKELKRKVQNASKRRKRNP